MFFGEDLTQLAFVAMVIVAVGGVVLGLLFPLLSGSGTSKRVKAISEGRRAGSGNQAATLARRVDGQKDNRRKQIQETLNQIEERQKTARKRRMTLRMLIMQSGLDILPKHFWFASLGLGLMFAAIPFVLGIPWYIAIVAGIVGAFGFPRWFLSFLRRRRQNLFLTDFADAVDVMVRGLKAGLPVSDAMKVIAAESGPPVGPEFLDVVEGQRVGIAIDQGVERMYERMPLAEVNFLGIVMGIQAKTGGNLSEALSNLSKVLRDRKKMKAKIRAVSQEAKSSAAIIGSLPFVIMAAMTILNPQYLNPLFNTNMGNMLLIGSATWMTIGILVMRKMINFEV
jgi:tight adherence protein B